MAGEDGTDDMDRESTRRAISHRRDDDGEEDEDEDEEDVTDDMCGVNELGHLQNYSSSPSCSSRASTFVEIRLYVVKV